MSTVDEQFLRRAIRLAMNGRGKVEPNPMVGCVLVKEGRVIGEGFHEYFGGPHAEPGALANCIESPVGATAYVTLEPCCHSNKKTPPCAPKLMGAEIARAVIGCLDPNPQVNGNGIRMLRSGGIQVDVSLLENECKQLIAPFLARVNFQRPYVTMKWAESADGKIAGPGGARRQISNAISKKLVHQLRSRSDAIAVGIGTVLADDPDLTVRGVEVDLSPQRIVLDSSLRTPVDSKLVRSAAKTPTTLICGDIGKPKKSAYLDAKVTVIEGVTKDAGRMLLSSVFLPIPHAAHLLVEAGPTLAASFFSSNLADRLWVFRSPNRIDDATAPSAAVIPDHFQKTGELQLGSDILIEYLNTRSPVFYANAASADLTLARRGG